MNLLKVYILTTVLSILVPSVVDAQGGFNRDQQFIHFTVDDGLSNHLISDIHQSQDGFIWIATQYGLNRYDGVSMESYVYEPDNPYSLSNNWVTSITEDNHGHMWLGTYGKGLHKYDPKLESFEKYWSDPEGGCLINVIGEILIDRHQKFWIGSLYNNLYLVDSVGHGCYRKIELGINPSGLFMSDRHVIMTSNEGVHVYDPSTGTKLTQHFNGQSVSASCFYHGVVYLGMSDGLYEVKLDKGGAMISSKKKLGLEDINEIVVSEDVMWIATDNGLSKMDMTSEEVGTYIHNANDPQSIIPGALLSLHLDRDDNLWIGGRQGLCMLPDGAQSFSADDYPRLIKSQREIHAIATTDGGTVWLGGEKGLRRYDLSDPTSSQLIIDANIWALVLSEDGSLQVGTSYRDQKDQRIGVYRVDTSSQKVEQYRQDGSDPDYYSRGRTLSMVEDQYGGILAAISSHLMYRCAECKTFRDVSRLIPFDFDRANLLISMTLDDEDNLWIGTTQAGAVMVDWRLPDHAFTDDEVATYEYDSGDPQSISSNLIQYVYKHSQGDIWLGTDGGINRYVDSINGFDRFVKADGLIDDKVLAITEDNYGRLWMSTISHGLLCFDPGSSGFTYYREVDGLYHDAFLLHSVGRAVDGTLMFGNERGVQVFKPQEEDGSVFKDRPLLFSKLLINNKEAKPSESEVLSLAPEYTSAINLNYGQNDLTLSYAIPYYTHKDRYRYRYRLSGSTDQWVATDRIDRLSFTRLASGRYTLEVEACLGNTCIYSDPLSIYIIPPWWRSLWAFLCYVALIICGITFTYRSQIRRKLRAQEQKKQGEINEAQSRFFANMTHELRTPLTLISGPARRLLAQDELDPAEVRKTVKGVKANADQILSLVNNLLDISKIDSGMVGVQLLSTNVAQFVGSIIDHFAPAGIDKDIEVVYHADPSIPALLLDRDKVRIILSNILSNAIKYSDRQDVIHVDVEYGDGSLLMTVSDTGRGITVDRLPKIFDRFYRADAQLAEGTGIGLSLVKELVSLLDGDLVVNSTHGVGTTMSVKLPVSLIKEKGSYEEREIINIKEERRQPDILDSGKPLILLVEDNEAVSSFIIDGLSSRYAVRHVTDGQEGYHKAIEMIPDMIISDVMMPVMDGYEMCQKLKGHTLTDHVPIILLTARADQASRIEGMQSGADAFLTKPFDDQELELLIDNTLSTRKSLMAKVGVIEADQSNERQDSPFLTQAITVIHDLIKEDKMNILTLCKRLAVSRTQLHRKIKGLTELSTTHFINEVKLKKATNLLRGTALSISEIAYESGFNDPSYFAQAFSKRFDCSATEYRSRTVG